VGGRDFTVKEKLLEVGAVVVHCSVGAGYAHECEGAHCGKLVILMSLLDSLAGWLLLRTFVSSLMPPVTPVSRLRV
jgi:hypothetical protein